MLWKGCDYDHSCLNMLLEIEKTMWGHPEVWDGHSCPLLLILILILVLVLLLDLQRLIRLNFNTKVKSDGQECPSHMS